MKQRQTSLHGGRGGVEELDFSAKLAYYSALIFFRFSSPAPVRHPRELGGLEPRRMDSRLRGNDGREVNLEAVSDRLLLDDATPLSTSPRREESSMSKEARWAMLVAFFAGILI